MVFIYVYVWDLNEIIFYMVGNTWISVHLMWKSVSCSDLDYKHLSLSQFFIPM